MKLTTNKRNRMRASSFALPEQRAYPINDKAHARNALSRLHNATPAEQKKIKAAIKSRYPGLIKK
tara:strand:- start:2400 stop:2594 length:195 start_codon:yes stop_codon:yes gene_type:complete